MLRQHAKRHIRLVTVEKPTMLVVFAVLLETTGNETIALSEPRLVKVIPKRQALALEAGVQTKTFLLEVPQQEEEKGEPIPSPYQEFFSYGENFVLAHVGARPPTRSVERTASSV